VISVLEYVSTKVKVEACTMHILDGGMVPLMDIYRLSHI